MKKNNIKDCTTCKYFEGKCFDLIYYQEKGYCIYYGLNETNIPIWAKERQPMIAVLGKTCKCWEKKI